MNNETITVKAEIDKNGNGAFPSNTNIITHAGLPLSDYLNQKVKHINVDDKITYGDDSTEYNLGKILMSVEDTDTLAVKNLSENKVFNLISAENLDSRLNDIKLQYLMFKGNELPDLSSYNGKPLYLINENPITISNIVLSAWTQWYFPMYSTGDCIGFAIYPTASTFTIIGHCGNEYYAHKLY